VAGMTFSSLMTQLQAYLERGTPSDATVFEQLPNLINTAERAIARRIKVEGFLASVLSTLTGGLAVYSKPALWRQTVSMGFASDASELAADNQEEITTESGLDLAVSPVTGQARQLIFPRSLEYCQQYWPDLTQTGAPRFYADWDYNHWLLVPTPDLAYPWNIVYYQLPPLLGDQNQTNWLTDFAPNLLLYRALLEATPFLKNDERIGTWQQFFSDEMAATNTEDLARAADRSAKRNNP
jgi:hypothetical protein